MAATGRKKNSSGIQRHFEALLESHNRACRQLLSGFSKNQSVPLPELKRRVYMLQTQLATDADVCMSMVRGEEHTDLIVSRLRQQRMDSDKTKSPAAVASPQSSERWRSGLEARLHAMETKFERDAEVTTQRTETRSAQLQRQRQRVADLSDDLRRINNDGVRTRVEGMAELSEFLKSIERRVDAQEVAAAQREDVLRARVAALEHQAAALAEEARQRNELVKGVAERVGEAVQGLRHRVDADYSELAAAQPHSVQEFEHVVKRAVKELRDSLLAQQEDALSAVEVDRQIETSRLSGRVQSLSDRMQLVESSVVAEHESSIQQLELLLAKKGSRANTPHRTPTSVNGDAMTAPASTPISETPRWRR